MPYAILRFEKRKGGPATAIEKHHERTKEYYGSNPDIDRERSHLNYGRKLKLPVWWQSWGANYSPAESYINFADEVYDDSRWYCTYRKKQNEYIRWMRAEAAGVLS